MSKTIVTIAACLVTLAGGSWAEISYDKIDIAGGSRSRHISDEAKLHQLVHLLEQGVQQFDLGRIATLLSADPSSSQSESIPPEWQPVFDSLFSSANSLMPAVESSHWGWISGAFDQLNFSIDSVNIGKGDACVYLSGNWVGRRNRDGAAASYTLSLSKTGFRWHLSGLAQLATIIGDYLLHSENRLERPAVEGAAPGRTQLERYQEWLSTSSVHLLLERAFREGVFDRFTKTVSLDNFDTRVFSCAGIPSTYYYADDPTYEYDISIGAVSDHCWQRFVVADYEHDYVVARGREGTGANIHEFRMPGGLEFRNAGLLYICDRGNNRIKVIEANPDWADKVYLAWMIDSHGLNDQVDVDVMRDGRVVVAEYGSNSIYAFCDHPSDPPPDVCGPRRHYTTSSYGPIDRPISVSFGRDPMTSVKTRTAYIVDKDGRRLLRVVDVFSDSSAFFEFSAIPDPAVRISSIAVDNKGQVWVTDHERGKIYKFDDELRLLAIHGREGTGFAQYLYPEGLSFAQAYQYVGEHDRPEPMPAVSEAVLTEKWAAETGIRRLVAGVDIVSPEAHYFPRLKDGSPDYIEAEFFITGYADLTIEFQEPAGIHESISHINKPSGPHSVIWYLPTGAESGTYRIEITAVSVHNYGNTATATLFVDVDRSIID